MNKKKNLKIICGVLALFVITSMTAVFFVPNFQFRTYEMNRAFGITFGFLSSILFLLLFWIIKDIKSDRIKQFLIFLNGFALIFAIGNLAVYSSKIDPNIQFRDYKILYINKENDNEKIVNQYDINWKTLKKEYQNNHVVDYGVFRIYKSYRIDTLELKKENWKKNN